ncbi:hypothetical protein BD324DRAFT_680664 [Kockovaella imperatae]|uniref:Uncharacterized protein n=1 Tax=Kockovaella imperatae TaxID=4999 RepID=A0A1Y1UIE4_9TREE|nr:hypothetical protein BD324DRAFT_680664 [Kockovaella imperatae]ORX37782.1 hypothetical protein BD324DRAFT_680664 [Kockovaella imperatae]
MSKEPDPSPSLAPSSSVHFAEGSLDSLRSEPGPSTLGKSRSSQLARQAQALSRSPSLPAKAERRASLVTGGYITSESESDGPRPPPSPLRLQQRSRAPSDMDSPRTRRASRIPSRVREITSSPDSRKGKERAHNGLASSLGIDTSRQGLTSAQINDLLNDTDVVSALRMMNNSTLAARLSASRQDTVTAPTTHTDPFIPRAPPALMPDGGADIGRDRSVSNASTIIHGRRMSEIGGHVPFTHPITFEGDTTEDDRSREATVKPRQHRLSNLFKKKHQVSDVEAHSITSRSERDEQAQDRDLEMRRLEALRREEELLQERRFKALTLVAAHPDSERLAYKASSHLRHYYNLVYEGIDNPPRLNPLAVLRWKHKTEEQLNVQAHWEKMNRLSVAPSWRYTMDDVVAYQDAKGIVNYFIPPREPVNGRYSGESSLRSGSSHKLGSKTESISKTELERTSSEALSRSVSQHNPHVSIGSERLTQAIKNPFDRINKRHDEPSKARSITDDEHPFHLRNLLPRTREPRKSLEVQAQDRQAELEALQMALARETALRKRRDAVEKQVDKEVEQARLAQNEIYEEKQNRLREIRHRIELIDGQDDDDFRQYFLQSDQVASVAASFGIKATFPNLEKLRNVYGTDRRIQPLWVNPHPRDSPVARVEAALARGREAHSAFLHQRAETARQLQSMITRIDAMMKQKDAVRSWTKAALESNRVLRANMESLNAQVVGNSRARMRRVRDRLIDFGVRQGLGQIFKLCYKLWEALIWTASWRTPTARKNLRQDQKGWKGVPYGTFIGVAVIGMIILFYHVGEG